MSERFQFNRLEVAGSLGDLGTLLPMLIGMILIFVYAFAMNRLERKYRTAKGEGEA